MTWVYIIGSMCLLGLLSWVVGVFSEKQKELWRGTLLVTVFFGILWLADIDTEKDVYTYMDVYCLRFLSLLLAFVLPYALVVSWAYLEKQEELDRIRNQPDGGA
jgi:hypothetical protein